MDDISYNRHGIHVSLMWQGFAEFISMQKTDETQNCPDFFFLQHATLLRETLSAKHANEWALRNTLERKLSFLGNFTSVTLSGGAQTDLTLVTDDNKPYVNIELKLNFGSGGKDAILQNTLYYVHAFREAPPHLNPMILITIVGCHFFQVFGAVFGPDDKILVDPLCDAISLLNVPHDPLHLDLKFASLLYSLKRTFAKLKRYYETLSASSSCPCVPYYNNDSTLEYIEPIPICTNGRVWKGKMNDREVVVKFTLMYNSSVHKLLHQNGMAPEIFAEDELCGGWKVIVMEYIVGQSLHECCNILTHTQKQDIKDKLKNALQIMKTANFVHGDLRLPNIMIESTTTSPFIIDFDWAGISGDVKYPINLNPSVRWPDDARSGLPIRTTHDLYMIEQLFEEL